MDAEKSSSATAPSAIYYDYSFNNNRLMIETGLHPQPYPQSKIVNSIDCSPCSRKALQSSSQKGEQ
jgi:hypothetical protein